MPTITDIENKIIDVLKAQLDYLKTCKSLGEGMVNEIKDLTIQYPAIYVVYERGEYSRETIATQDKKMIFGIIVMAKNYRGDEAARQGQGGTKGAYDLLEDVRAELTNNDLELDIDPLMPVDESPLETQLDQAAYVIRFETSQQYFME
jgi:phage gp37-like protein